jgi:hypothetical protein
MLIRTDSHPPYDKSRTNRLIYLEKILRRSSDSSITISQYKELLENAETFVVPTERTLQEDLRRYTHYCDDVIYGNHAKKLRLDPDATRDAVIEFLGKPWLDSPLRPRISSSCARCLLLAQELKAEVTINYSPLRKSGEPWVPKQIVGIPICAIPGADSGYFQLHIAKGYRMNLNLSRVQRFVRFTEQSTEHYAPLPEQRQLIMILEVKDAYLLERLVAQFAGFKKLDKNRAELIVEESLKRMTLDMLEGHLGRTKSTQRNLPNKATLKINEDVEIQINEYNELTESEN